MTPGTFYTQMVSMGFGVLWNVIFCCRTPSWLISMACRFVTFFIVARHNNHIIGQKSIYKLTVLFYALTYTCPHLLPTFSLHNDSFTEFWFLVCFIFFVRKQLSNLPPLKSSLCAIPFRMLSYYWHIKILFLCLSINTNVIDNCNVPRRTCIGVFLVHI